MDIAFRELILYVDFGKQGDRISSLNLAIMRK